MADGGAELLRRIDVARTGARGINWTRVEAGAASHRIVVVGFD